MQNVFLSERRLATLKQRVADKVEPTYSAFLAMQTQIDPKLGRTDNAPQEWFVPSYYVHGEAHHRAKQGLRDDANEAYGMALIYRMTGQRKYAELAIALIDAWSGVSSFRTEDDSTLSFSYHFPGLIYAASLLRSETDLWPTESQAKFEAFLREKAFPLNCMDHRNNWGNWGAVLVMSVAAYLDDGEMMGSAVERWKYFIEDQLADDGHLWHEVNRQVNGDRGLWYSHFCLMPQTVAAEIARVYGIDLYDYVSPAGHTLRQAYDTLTPWTADPTTFPYYKGEDPVNGHHDPDYISYWELLNSRWPNPQATDMIERMRPLTADHATPFLTFTHGDLPPKE